MCKSPTHEDAVLAVPPVEYVTLPEKGRCAKGAGGTFVPLKEDLSSGCSQGCSPCPRDCTPGALRARDVEALQPDCSSSHTLPRLGIAASGSGSVS